MLELTGGCTFRIESSGEREEPGQLHVLNAFSAHRVLRGLGKGFSFGLEGPVLFLPEMWTLKLLVIFPTPILSRAPPRLWQSEKRWDWKQRLWTRCAGGGIYHRALASSNIQSKQAVGAIVSLQRSGGKLWTVWVSGVCLCWDMTAFLEVRLWEFFSFKQRMESSLLGKFRLLIWATSPGKLPGMP